MRPYVIMMICGCLLLLMWRMTIVQQFSADPSPLLLGYMQRPDVAHVHINQANINHSGSLLNRSISVHQPEKTFRIIHQGQIKHQVLHYRQALDWVKHLPGSSIVYDGQTIWSRTLPPSTHLSVPRISQMPHLPRGCEVTSLAMVLQYEGYSVNSLELAKNIKKDLTPYRVKEGKIYYGHPQHGFVGNMYDLRKRGYGVYHRPVAELASQYAQTVLDLTGGQLQDILYLVSIGHPVWVIHNVYFDKVPSSYWQTWHTPSGPIKITFKEHSVVIRGYDDQYIYIVDPLTKRNKVKRDAFERGWRQMGSQAIALYRSHPLARANA